MWNRVLTTTTLVTTISFISACGLLENSPSDIVENSPNDTVELSPSETVEKIVKKAEDGETNQALELFSDETINTMGRNNLRTSLSNMVNAEGFLGITIVEEEINGDVAEVTIETESSSDANAQDRLSQAISGDTSTLVLVKDEGEWKYSHSN